MLQPNEVIRQLWDTGHFSNPVYRNEVTESDLGKLRLTDHVVRDAIKSYQEFLGGDFDRFSMESNYRPGRADGEIGPATMDLLEMERCGHPDFMPEAATGSGSWPAGCHPDWPENHTFTIQVDKSRMPAFLGAKDDPNSIFEQAFELCRMAYAYIGLVLIREDDNPRAQTLVTFERGRGWIGLAVVGRALECGDRIWAKFDTKYQPSALVFQWAKLLMHEFGHNVGMSHYRGGVMNATITRGVVTFDEWIGDPGFPFLKRAFGGVPVDLGGGPKDPDDPTPGPPKPGPPGPEPGEYWHDGVVVLKNGDRPLRRFILTPAPEV